MPSEDEGEEAKFTADTSWYTYEENRVTEYTLTTAAQLAGFNKLQAEGTTFEGITIKLGNDITINKGDAARKFADGELKYTWQLPSKDKPFKGTFDGCGYTIYGIYMEQGASYQGMFGSVEGSSEDKGKPAVIKNFTLENTYAGSIAGKDYFGVVAGRVYGLVEIFDITCNAVVEGNMKYVGGLVGSVLGVETGSNQNEAVLTMRNCTFSGSINVSGNNAGGMIGYTSGKNAKITLDGCTTTGSVAAASNAGKIIGSANKGNITLSDYTEKDGVIGSITTNNVAAGSLVITYKDENGEETDPTDPSVPSEDEGEGAKFTADTSWYTGTADTYVLMDAEDLLGFQKLRAEGESFEGSTIKLGADIRINEGTAAEIKAEAAEDSDSVYTWVGNNDVEEPFKGTFDGQNYTISGVYMQVDTTYNGMFGWLGGTAQIKNFTLSDSYFGGTGEKQALGAITGGVAADGNVMISDVTCNATLEGDGKFYTVGGFVGRVDKKSTLTMTNCTFGGNITNVKEKAGGMIGEVSNGSASVTLTNCKNIGTNNIKATTYSGDIIGYANKGTIQVKGCIGNGEWIGGMNATQVEAGKLTVISVYGGTPDTSWYTDTADTYTLMTAEELMGFQMLRAGNVGNKMKTFEGYTINLGVNVVINEGTMDANTDSSSVVSWPNLGDKETDCPFKGTFDGQNHTISGLYMTATNSYKGMFGVLGDSANIKNFTLNNSYFKCTGKKQALGSIAGYITGNQVTIENVTSNATLVGDEEYKCVGGLIGYITANDSNYTVNVTGCTFGGKVSTQTNLSTTASGAGGIIGFVTYGTITVNLTKCICTDTATITGTNSGKMIGYVNKGTINLYDYSSEEEAAGAIGNFNASKTTINYATE